MNFLWIAHSPAWNAAGWTMLHVIGIGIAVGLVGALLRRRLRRARPELRHGVAIACLLALATAPLFLFMFNYRPEHSRRAGVASAIRITAQTGPATSNAALPPVLAPRRSDVGPHATEPRDGVAVRFEALVAYLPGVWLSGSLLTLALLATGLIGVERLRRSSLTLESGAIAELSRALAPSLGIARRVGVAVCDRVVAPVLIGIVRPMILLPPAALNGWSLEQVEMALLHELAHLRRHDNLVNLFQRLVESWLFFHPVTWWLSAWIRLERELCCDRLVVDRTGRPHAYAKMLAALAESEPGASTMALAMAERPLLTRIRRIMDMEERSMKMTLPEGLALLAAAIVGATMTLAADAESPQAKPDDSARQTLNRLAERVVALPKDEGRGVEKGEALLEIARAQLKLGDRSAALATLRHLDGLSIPLRVRLDSKDGPGWSFFVSFLVASVEIRRDAGDLDGARATLDRAAHSLEALDSATIRAAYDRVEKDMKAAVAKKGDGPMRAADEEAALLLEATFGLIDQRIALGDTAEAQALIQRTVKVIGPVQGPTKSMMVGALGGYLVKAGDPHGGHNLIEQARRATLAMSDPVAVELGLPWLAATLADAGDLDGALALIREMNPTARQSAFGRILDGISTDDQRVAWLDPAGIKITIGDQSLTPKDPATARTLLPKIAATARGLGDAKGQARTLATVAHLQARAGDCAGALATAESIPDLKRSDFPGPSDGFYDAVKPATFAIIAAILDEAGDKPGGSAAFDRSQTLARAVAPEDQKLIAQIVIAQKQAACGRKSAAQAVITEAMPLALTQPEPRRSRVLTMLAEAQVKAGDGAGALRTIDAIREYPGLEKVRALHVLAGWHEEAGDAAISKNLRRRALACLEAKAPDTPLPGKMLTVKAFSRETFIDFDLEFDPTLMKFHREMMLQGDRAKVSDLESAVREAKALPPARRDASLSRLAGSIARNGDVSGAMDLAETIESPDARLSAFVSLAVAIRFDGRSIKAK